MAAPTQLSATRLSQYDLDIPQRLIAQYPPAERDRCNLMLVERSIGRFSTHDFGDLPGLLAPGDTLILNDTRVFPARLITTREQGGGTVEVLLHRELEPDRWEVLVKPGRRARPGQRLEIGPATYCELETASPEGGRVVRFHHTFTSIFDLLDKYGRAPLPPYIRREPEPADNETYQTVFARERGAVAAPTAGLHFTDRLLAQLKAMGIRIAYLTLHVGLGTFQPVRVEDLSLHSMAAEHYHLTPETAALINDTTRRGRRVVAVGTTVTRTLETLATGPGEVRPGNGWTEKFIYPPYDFQVVTGLVTNFHMPQSTLLMLVSAFAGRELIFKSYRYAVAQEYRFYSYGDAMLIL